MFVPFFPERRIGTSTELSSSSTSHVCFVHISCKHNSSSGYLIIQVLFLLLRVRGCIGLLACSAPVRLISHLWVRCPYLSAPLSTFRAQRMLAVAAAIVEGSIFVSVKCRCIGLPTCFAFVWWLCSCLVLVACSAPVHLVWSLWVWCPYLRAFLPTCSACWVLAVSANLVAMPGRTVIESLRR